MKKVFFSLAVVAAMTMVSCKETQTETEEVVVPTEEVTPVEEVAPANDTIAIETTTETTETTPAAPAQ